MYPLTKNDIKIHLLKENLIFTGEDSPMANLLLSIMGAFAEFERVLTKERKIEGIALAKNEALNKERKSALTPTQGEEIKSRISKGNKKSHIARNFSISRKTPYTIFKKTSNLTQYGSYYLDEVRKNNALEDLKQKKR